MLLCIEAQRLKYWMLSAGLYWTVAAYRPVARNWGEGVSSRTWLIIDSWEATTITVVSLRFRVFDMVVRGQNVPAFLFHYGVSHSLCSPGWS